MNVSGKSLRMVGVSDWLDSNLTKIPSPPTLLNAICNSATIFEMKK